VAPTDAYLEDIGQDHIAEVVEFSREGRVANEVYNGNNDVNSQRNGNRDRRDPYRGRGLRDRCGFWD
jgi:hypothetical protein